MKHLLLATAISLVSFSLNHHKPLCEGFIPENDLYYPVTATRNISEADFNDVLDRIEKVYRPIVEAKGGTLTINRRWSDGKVNATAQQWGDFWSINMFGGLARHPEVTKDGFAVVACHEIGHHLGGAPQYGGFFGYWASNEGQADYFSTLKCMRKIYTDQESLDTYQNNKAPSHVVARCIAAFENEVDRGACIRSTLAGMSVSRLFQNLNKKSIESDFLTPDQSVVSSTYHKHPKHQCRLDTYYAGALCNVKVDVALSNTDITQGTCSRKAGHSEGLRPLCWLKP